MSKRRIFSSLLHNPIAASYQVAGSVSLPKSASADVHVYSPGVQGYKPIQLGLQEIPGIEFQPVVYPSSKTLYLEAIKEQVPVFEGKFRITQDLTVVPSKTSDAIRAVFSQKDRHHQRPAQVSGLRQNGMLPSNVGAVELGIRGFPLDLKRSPEAIQHK
jgi:hypothetical protein